jgi:hypothetical protein
MKTPWRCWFTGGVAAVLAAASQARPALEDGSISISSRYSVEETSARIEVQARADGLPVFAKLNTPAHGGSRSLMLVLGTDAAHTAILQRLDGGALAVPLTLRVMPRDDGGSEVRYTALRGIDGQGALPPEVLGRLALLPALMQAALDARNELPG